MTEQPAPDQSNGGESGTTPPETQTEFIPITTQADLDRVIGERVKRVKAQYGDYAEAKAKAARFDEIQAAQQTEAERLAAQIETERQAAETARVELLRYQVAARHGISDPDDIDLFLTGRDEETLTRQAERLSQRAAGDPVQPRTPRPDPAQGRSGSPVAATAREQFAAWSRT